MSQPKDLAQTDAPDYGAPHDQPELAPYGAAPGQPPAQTQAPAEEAAKIGEAGRFTGVLFSPGATFEDINRKPTWIVPLAIAILAAVAFSWFLSSHFDEGWHQFMRKTLEERARQSGGAQPSPQDIDRGVGFAKYFGLGISVVGTILVNLIIAGVLALGMMFLQAQTTFKKILSVVMWSWAVTSVLQIIVTIASVMARGSESGDFNPQKLGSLSATNLAFLMPDDSSAFIKGLAGTVDVFSIWFLILLTIGLAAVSGSRKIKSGSVAPMVFGLWIITALIRAGMAAAFGR
jgi:Yip1-like protein